MTMHFTSFLAKRMSLFSVQARHGSTIKVLLIQNLANKGVAGEIVTVKRGHFRNLLYPRKIAVYNTPINQEKYMYLIRKANNKSTSSDVKGTESDEKRESIEEDKKELAAESSSAQ